MASQRNTPKYSQIMKTDEVTEDHVTDEIQHSTTEGSLTEDPLDMVTCDRLWHNDADVLEKLIAIEKEKLNLLKNRQETKSANHYLLLSLVPMLDSLTEEDQMEAREQIIAFTYRLIREKISNV